MSFEDNLTVQDVQYMGGGGGGGGNNWTDEECYFTIIQHLQIPQYLIMWNKILLENGRRNCCLLPRHKHDLETIVKLHNIVSLFQLKWECVTLKSRLFFIIKKTPRVSWPRGGIYIVSTDRDVPLVWVCFFSDLVRVWVDNSCSRYLYDP